MIFPSGAQKGGSGWAPAGGGLAQAERKRRVLEFLMVGGSTLVLAPLFWILRAFLGMEVSELAVGFLAFHAATLINDPHFAVTYLLFYRDVRRRAFGEGFGPVQRVRYWIAGLAVPLLLGVCAVVGLALGWVVLIGGMIQLMFLLVGWHYVKQGFGVLSVLAARRGFRFGNMERRVLLTHCYAAWAFAWANPPQIAVTYEENGVLFVGITRPPWLESVCLVAVSLSSLWLVLVVLRRRLSSGEWPPVGPFLAFLISVWIWTVFASVDPLMRYVIPALHSVQYLYFVWLLKRQHANAPSELPDFKSPRARLTVLGLGAVFLGWLLLHGAPEFLDSLSRVMGHESPLGPTPYLAVFVTFVNVHHYFMDAVIWRRENPETRHLGSQAISP